MGPETQPPRPVRTQLRDLSVLIGPFQDPKFDAFPDTPHKAFQVWLDQAIESGVREPHAMTVSTVDSDGCPDARVLILKDVNERGWHFAAKGESPKAQQIASNPSIALTFYWPQVGRQIRIRGRGVQLPDKECREDFEARPFKSQVSAAASKQSKVLESRDELRRRVDEVESVMARGQDLGASGKWKVYAVAPIAVEFWQGSNDRLHQRLQYTVTENGKTWLKDLLWP